MRKNGGVPALRRVISKKDTFLHHLSHCHKGGVRTGENE